MIASAILLAAGRGTRLGNLTDDIPKPMLQVGGTPLIDRIVAATTDAGISRLIVVTGYLADQMEEHVRAVTGAEVLFIRQEQALGTGHAVAICRRAAGSAPVFVGWGDIATSTDDYGLVMEAFEPGLDAVIAVNHVADPWAGGAVMIDADGFVSSILEKPPPGTSVSNWNNAGLMVFAPTMWPHIEAIRPSARNEYELPDAVNSMIATGGKVKAIEISGPWFDIGTPDSLAAARAAFG